MGTHQICSKIKMPIEIGMDSAKAVIADNRWEERFFLANINRSQKFTRILPWHLFAYRIIIVQIYILLLSPL